MASPQMIRDGRKRANSALEVGNAKRLKPDQSIVGHGRGSGATRTDHNEVNGYPDGGSPALGSQLKAVGNDVSINPWLKEVVLIVVGQHHF